MKQFTIFFTLVTLVICEEFKLEKLFDYEQFKSRIETNLATVKADGENTCNQQMVELLQNNKQAFWELFDATSKFPWTGLSEASLTDWGNYDQCVNINHEYSGGKINGKYCLSGLVIPSNLSTITDINTFYKLGLCMPSGCTGDDYNKFFNLGSLPLFNSQACNTKEDLEKFTPGDIAMIVVFVVFGVIIIISTTYDVYLSFRKEKKRPHPMFVAFSIFTNGRKLFHTSKGNKEQIQIFNGLKTISMAWIVSGHAVGAWNVYSVINTHIVENYLSKLKAAYLSTSQLSVDTFFYMSGFLLAYLYMKQKGKPIGKQINSIPYLIIHRYFRLTPAVAMMYFFYITIFKHFGTGPLWKNSMGQLNDACTTNWWPFFLYIQNYYNYDNFCLVHTWYLSADMQMFIISPIILIPMTALLAKNSKNLNFVMILMSCLNIILVILPLTLKLVFTDYVNQYETHSRMMDWTMGMMVGIYMREARHKPFLFGKIRNLSLVNFIIWTVILILMTVTALLHQEITYGGYSQTAQSIVECLMRPAWCLGLSWMVYSCTHGYGGIIKWILTRPTLQITAKLSYCMYLMHGLVIVHFTLLTRTRLYFNDYFVFMNWCGYFIVTFIVSIIWSLSFESPLIILEKMIFGGGAPRRSKAKRPSQHVEAKSNGEQYVEKEKF